MEQTAAIWFLILLALVAANAPFAAARPFLVLPWSTGNRPWLVQLLDFLVYALLLAGWVWLVHWLLSEAPLLAGWQSALLFVAKLAAVVVGAFVVLGYPGWRMGQIAGKPFIVRLLEVLLFYFMVGAIGFALEASAINPFPKGWEFYAITLSLFLVMAYPGYVYRYLLRHPSSRRSAVATEKK